MCFCLRKDGWLSGNISAKLGLANNGAALQCVFALCIYLTRKQLHRALPGIIIPDGYNKNL